MRFAAVLLSMVISIGAFAQGMKLNEDLTWQQVLKKAADEKKPIFVDAYTTWCGPCKWMAKNVFPTDSAGAFYNANFVSYKLDMEKGEGVEFAKKYKVAFFPTYLYFDKEGNLVHRSGGSKPVSAFIKDGMNALDPSKQLVSLSKQFADNPGDKKIVYNYALALSGAGESDAGVAEAFYKLSDDNERLSPEAFLIFSEQSDLNSPSFNFLKENRKKFKGIEEADVHDAILARYEDKVISLGKKKDLNGFNALNESIENDLGKRASMEMRVLYYGAAKDHANKMKYATELFNDPKYDDPSMLNSLAWYVYEAPSATEQDLKTALEWSEKSLKLERRWHNLDTYASLLYRLKKYDEAKKYAEEAIMLAEKDKEDAKGTKELLKMIEKR